MEMDSYIGRNAVVDAVLKIIFDEAENRRVIISSFDPDVCILAALKQPRYPVFFLTEGGTVMYKDHRCNSIEAAVEYAKFAHLAGIVTDCRPILQQPEHVPFVKQQGLLLFTYGAENSDPANVELQKKLELMQ